MPKRAKGGLLLLGFDVRPGVGAADDVADPLLIEAFEPLAALDIFQVAADGALFGELRRLGLVDLARSHQSPEWVNGW